jgi:hypothetical protein
MAAQKQFKFNTITRNTNNGCDETIRTLDSNVVINNNNLYGNDIVSFGQFYEVRNLVTRQWYYTPATNGAFNWWNKNLTASIDSTVMDYSDDTALTKFNYQPFLTSPDTTAPETPPTGVTKTDLGGGNIQLTWNPNPDADLAGYKVYWGNPTGYSFSNAVDVGNVTSYILNGPSISDSIAVTAYDHEAANNNDQCECHESWFTTAAISTTGIVDIKNAMQFSYFPNPASDRIEIKYQLPTKASSGVLIISTIDGKEAERIQLSKNSNHTSLSIAYLQNGIYTLQLFSSDETSSKGKLVIMR